MASHPNSHPIPPASNLSHRKVKRNSSSSATRPPAVPALNLSHRKGKQASSSSSSSSSSTATCPPTAPASNLSHRKGKQTSSSSSTATCPPAAPPSSSSVDHPEIKYDVFLSFRGTDTRSGFLSHLLEGLAGKNIDYFVDDKKLKQGDEISSTLLNAIKQSAISLVLFSKDYAYSRWCLEELQQILKCRKNQNQIVLPIFYKVDPSIVRHQKKSYNKAFDELGKRFDKRRLQKWQTALKKAADLSGFHSSNYNTEAILIREIVEHVLVELRKAGNQTDLKGFVGIHEYIQYLETRLQIESQDILTIGIWGMAGVGKTTIAEILYNRLCNKYEGSCLLCIREKIEAGRSIRDLKEDLLSKLLGEVAHDVTLNGNLDYVKRRLQRKKVLVVLDDINDLDHLEILIGKQVWFGQGSRIIMTSRDKHVFSKGCIEIYVVQPLNSEYALQLCKIYFERSSIEKQALNELSQWVVNYAKGIPLVIKVLCGYFSGDKSEEEWKSKLEKLKKIPDSKVQKVLELSYNGLDDEEHKAIFLYLACFFRRESRERIISLLDKCGYHTIDCLRTLQDKALITISKHGLVFMHDLICAMGREIVRKTSPQDPGQRSHLWDVADIHDVFKNEMGTRSIESIRLDMWRLEKDLQLGPQAFAGMNNLRLLQFEDNWTSESKPSVYPPKEGFESFPKVLRCLIWAGYPSRSLPPRFCSENLVELRFEGSKLQRLWSGRQDLPNLKVLDLSGSYKLIELPDLSGAPKLEGLFLLFCHNLRHDRLWPNHKKIELDSTKRQEATLELKFWKRKISRYGSYILSLFFIKIQNHNKVELGSADCTEPLINTEELEEDDYLDLCRTSLPMNTSFKDYVLPSLKVLRFNLSRSLTEIPDNIGICCPSLQSLSLLHTDVKALPASIKHLSQLTELELRGCDRLLYIPELPPSIQYFEARHCTSLKTLQFSSNAMPLSHQIHRLKIVLYYCITLDNHELEAVARYYKLITQSIISASIEEGYASLFIPRSKVPKPFGGYRATQDLVSIPLELPLHSQAMGFIFYFVLLDGYTDYSNQVKIECHIEVNNIKIQFIYYAKDLELWGNRSDRVVFWYESSLSLKIMEEVSSIKASATTNDLYAKAWFKLSELPDGGDLKKWGVHPIFISSELQDLSNAEKYPDINDSDNSDNDDEV